MSIPLLSYSPSSRNHRVSGYEILGDEQPRIYTAEYLQSSLEMDALIKAAYRQIFHEQQMLDSNRQTCLESQLRTGQITVRDFIRGLAISDAFRRLNYESNNNYRFVQICVQRLLGREVYNEREKLAWSIVLASKGLHRFIDDLVDTEEYMSNFGYNTVPYQRRRILQGHSLGELPFARMARYGEDYRDKLPLPLMRKQVEPFNLQTFLRSSDRDVVLLLLASTLALIVLFSLLTTFGYFPKFGGY
ncbi:phycobilisome rod-core linker polypeptide CpcG [Nostoc sp. 'Peltigera membranacea cyanobiont' 210A]|uniref:phycobilisome rod-core linker polypeptide n=1 Tax=Nostoc sp. 'Peltigera membranacea cyanobiont' 210A TaxID=2014529 RepID=UPI000B9586C7|nr:phycobilisome rod-core linker polypeptide [Nostoc sp. 'Peltigera membranacea cyanobiont' 210A]OYD94045.1 phycobilisome rod-core linker polypeptide CpcG [Nostoc sp. 'Peltigera membranacea cyanobiont' 210A]